MTKTHTYDALPDYTVTPGDHIQEWLDEQDINAAELARRLDVTPKHVSELLSGKAPLSASVALGLERVTGIPARIWNRFEAIYREDLARLTEKAKLEAQYQRAKLFPLKYLRDWKVITAPSRDRAGTVRDLLALLRIGHLDAFDSTWVNAKVAYRKVPLGSDKTYEQATWLALGEREVSKAELPAFDREGLERLIPELRALTVLPDPLAAMGEAKAGLREVGVAVCLVPPVPGAGLYGATRWIAGNPVIQLSMRGRSDDQLWFTLFHELGHVLLHEQKRVFLQGTESAEEEEAHEFAARTFIPEEYVDRLPASRDIAAVCDLADELGIAPSIVLGQAQRLTGDHAWGHKLKVRLAWGTEVDEVA